MFATKDEIRNLGRLKKRSDFLHVQVTGRKWVSGGVIVQLAPNEGLGQRFGVTVTKKLHKKAVDRNRMKRVAREAYRLNKNLLKTGLLPDGFCIDIAFIYVKNELSVFTEVQKGIRKAIGEINVKLEKLEIEK